MVQAHAALEGLLKDHPVLTGIIPLPTSPTNPTMSMALLRIFEMGRRDVFWKKVEYDEHWKRHASFMEKIKGWGVRVARREELGVPVARKTHALREELKMPPSKYW